MHLLIWTVITRDNPLLMIKIRRWLLMRILLNAFQLIISNERISGTTMLLVGMSLTTSD
jgi:hypothetical protein